MNAGLGLEAEELGMVALIGVVLFPGVMWIANGKTITSKIIRTSVVGALVAGAVALEASIDKTVDSATGLLEGNA